MRVVGYILFFSLLCLAFFFGWLISSNHKDEPKFAVIQESKISLCKNFNVNYTSKIITFKYDLPITLNQTTMNPAIYNTTQNGNKIKNTKLDENISYDVHSKLENNTKLFYDPALYHCFFNNKYLRFFSFAEQETEGNSISLYLIKLKLIKILKRMESCKNHNFYENQRNILCFIDNFLNSEAGNIVKLADLAPIYEFIQKASLKNIKLKIYIILDFDNKNHLVRDYILYKENTTTKFTMENLSKKKYNCFKYFIEAKKDEEINNLVCDFK